jgi:hypothetical protein
MARGGKRKGAGRRMGAKDKKPRSSPVIIAPAQEKRELREAAREWSDDALKTLVKICNSGHSESARVAARQRHSRPQLWETGADDRQHRTEDGRTDGNFRCRARTYRQRKQKQQRNFCGAAWQGKA